MQMFLFVRMKYVYDDRFGGIFLCTFCFLHIAEGQGHRGVVSRFAAITISLDCKLCWVSISFVFLLFR